MSGIESAVRAYEAGDYAAARATCAGLEAHPQARFLLGLMAAYGEGGPADPVAAAAHYRAAAEAGHPGAMFNLADLHARGVGGPADLAEAGRWWERAAAAGEPRSMLALGRLYAAGEGGRPRDPGAAASWFFQAWQSGEDDAEQDIIRVRADLEAAAEAGSAAAQNAVGLLLCFGHDDPVAAAPWFEAAAAQGHPEALRMLGHLHAEGRGVPRDDARAADFFRRADAAASPARPDSHPA